MNTYLDVVCYRSKILADGTSPIMLRLTKDGKRKYVSLGISVMEKDWDFKRNTPKTDWAGWRSRNIVRIKWQSIRQYNGLHKICYICVKHNAYGVDI